MLTAQTSLHQPTVVLLGDNFLSRKIEKLSTLEGCCFSISDSSLTECDYLIDCLDFDSEPKSITCRSVTVSKRILYLAHYFKLVNHVRLDFLNGHGDVDTRLVALPYLYGPGMALEGQTPLNTLFRGIAEGRFLIQGSAEQVISPLYVDDLLFALSELMFSPRLKNQKITYKGEKSDTLLNFGYKLKASARRHGLSVSETQTMPVDTSPPESPETPLKQHKTLQTYLSATVKALPNLNKSRPLDGAPLNNQPLNFQISPNSKTFDANKTPLPPVGEQVKKSKTYSHLKLAYGFGLILGVSLFAIFLTLGLTKPGESNSVIFTIKQISYKIAAPVMASQNFLTQQDLLVANTALEKEEKDLNSHADNFLQGLFDGGSLDALGRWYGKLDFYQKKSISALRQQDLAKQKLTVQVLSQIVGSEKKQEYLILVYGNDLEPDLYGFVSFQKGQILGLQFYPWADLEDKLLGQVDKVDSSFNQKSFAPLLPHFPLTAGRSEWLVSKVHDQTLVGTIGISRSGLEEMLGKSGLSENNTVPLEKITQNYFETVNQNLETLKGVSGVIGDLVSNGQIVVSFVNPNLDKISASLGYGGRVGTLNCHDCVEDFGMVVSNSKVVADYEIADNATEYLVTLKLKTESNTKDTLLFYLPQKAQILKIMEGENNITSRVIEKAEFGKRRYQIKLPPGQAVYKVSYALKREGERPYALLFVRPPLSKKISWSGNFDHNHLGLSQNQIPLDSSLLSLFETRDKITGQK